MLLEVAPSGWQCSKSEIGPSGEAGVGVNLEGLAGRLKIHEQCWKAVERKVSADTQEYESCQQDDMELGGVGLRPERNERFSGSRERLRVKYMCDEKCDKEGFKFFHVGGRRRQAAHD